MPTYDYVCNECGRSEEHYYPHPDRAPAEMPCATVKRHFCTGRLKRQLGFGAGAIFKGPGFYSTDYRSGTLPKEDQ